MAESTRPATAETDPWPSFCIKLKYELNEILSRHASAERRPCSAARIRASEPYQISNLSDALSSFAAVQPLATTVLSKAVSLRRYINPRAESRTNLLAEVVSSPTIPLHL